MSQRAQPMSFLNERESRDLVQPINFTQKPQPGFYSFARNLGVDNASKRDADAKFHKHFIDHLDQKPSPLIKTADFDYFQPSNTNNNNDEDKSIPIKYCNTEDEFDEKPLTHRMLDYVQPMHSTSPFASPDKENYARKEGYDSRLSSPVRNSLKNYSNPFKLDANGLSSKSSARLPLSSRVESDSPFPNRSQNYYKPPTHRGQTPDVLRPDRVTPTTADSHTNIFGGNLPFSNRVSPARHSDLKYYDRGYQPREFNSDLQRNKSFITPPRAERSAISHLITPEPKFSPVRNLRDSPIYHQEQARYPLATNRQRAPQDPDFSYVPNKGQAINPIIEEYRKRNFQGVPIYRAKYFNASKRGSPERNPSFGSPERSNPQKHKFFQSSPSGALTERGNLATFGNKPTHEYANQRLPHQSPQKRSQVDRDLGRGLSPIERVPFDVLLTEISHKGEDNVGHPNISPFMYNRRPVTPDLCDSDRMYGIFRNHNLDFPYVIINPNAKKEPERPLEVYVEKKRKKKDDIDPFLQTLAKTFVVKDDSTSRRKSRALLKFEQAVQITNDELKEEEVKEVAKNASKNPPKIQTFKLPMPSENDRLSASQFSQESFSPMKKTSPSGLPDGKSLQINELKSLLIDQTPKSETPASTKLRPALRSSSTTSNTGEKKKESVVRISVPDKNSDNTQKEVAKKAEARSAGFMQKLNDMQQRSQRRLTTLIAHSEGTTPASNINKRGSGKSEATDTLESDDSDTS